MEVQEQMEEQEQMEQQEQEQIGQQEQDTTEAVQQADDIRAREKETAEALLSMALRAMTTSQSSTLDCLLGFFFFISSCFFHRFSPSLELFH